MTLLATIRKRIDARWRQILAYHYSAWLILLAGLLEGVSEAMPEIGIHIPDRYLIGAKIGVFAAAYISKIIVQKDRDQ